MRKIIRGLLIIGLLVPLAIVSLFIVFPLMNNMDLLKFEKQIKTYHLPEGTSIIEVQSVVGKLNGNGNSIDFFVGLLVQSDLSKNELLDHYENAHFVGAKKDKRKVLVEVLSADKELRSKYLEHRRRINFNSIQSINDFSDYYFVNIYDGGYPALFDLRGN